jgi:transposase
VERSINSQVNPIADIEPEAASADTQVKVSKKYASRRTFDTAYKLRILSAYEACDDASARGALLRKEGLYHSRIHAWKLQFAKANTSTQSKKSESLRTANLARENDQLKKQLAQAEAIIDLQKKVSELFTTHIRQPVNSEKKS